MIGSQHDEIDWSDLAIENAQDLARIKRRALKRIKELETAIEKFIHTSVNGSGSLNDLNDVLQKRIPL